MSANYVFSHGDCGVIWDGKRSEVTRQGVTCAQVLEVYDGDLGGLSIAIMRAMGAKRGAAREATETAQRIIALGPRKAHETWIDCA